MTKLYLIAIIHSLAIIAAKETDVAARDSWRFFFSDRPAVVAELRLELSTDLSQRSAISNNIGILKSCGSQASEDFLKARKPFELVLILFEHCLGKDSYRRICKLTLIIIGFWIMKMSSPALMFSVAKIPRPALGIRDRQTITLFLSCT